MMVYCELDFQESGVNTLNFSMTQMHLKMSFIKWRQFCLCLNVLIESSRKRQPLLPVVVLENWHEIILILSYLISSIIILYYITLHYITLSYLMLSYRCRSVMATRVWLVAAYVVLGATLAHAQSKFKFASLFPYYTPCSTKLKGDILVSPCPPVRWCVCGQNRVRSVSFTILAGSISFLHTFRSDLF